MAHNKVYGFCESGCKVEVDPAGKVKPIEEGGTGAKDRHTAIWNLTAVRGVKDCNDCTEIGYYSTGWDTLNNPISSYGVLMVYKPYDNWVVQIWISTNPNEGCMFVRKNINGEGFNKWYRIYTDTDVIPVDKGGTGATDALGARSKLGITPANIGAAANGHKHKKSEITDFPTSMPANDVYAWAKAASKPTYTAEEVGAAASSHKHTKSEITDFPTSMPASDVYEWAKAANKPSYTAEDVGAVKKTGDQMTGNLIVPYLRIHNNGGWIGADMFDEAGNYRAGFSCDESNRVFIRQKNKDMADGEYFCFSPPTTSGHWYDILTSKNPVTVAQGGTGAFTKKDARKNLGIEIQCGVAEMVVNGANITFPTPFSGVPVVTASNGTNTSSVLVRNITETGCNILTGDVGHVIQWQAIYISD